MFTLDMDHILSASPKKRFAIAFENMKNDYNEDTAYAFSQTYNEMPIRFVLEHVNDIMVDGWFGVPFLEKMVNSQETMFVVCPAIRRSVDGFLSAHGKEMPVEQRTVYESLSNTVNDIIDKHAHSIFVLEYGLDQHRGDINYIIKAVDDIYKSNKFAGIDTAKSKEYAESAADNALALLESSESFIALAPYVMKDISNKSTMDDSLYAHINPRVTGFNTTDWKSYVEVGIAVEALYRDDAYLEAVCDMAETDTKAAIENLMAQTPSDTLTARFTETVSAADLPTIGLTTESAVDNLFLNQYFLDIRADIDAENRTMLETASEILSDAYQNMMLFKSSYEGKLSSDFVQLLNERAVDSAVSEDSDFFLEASTKTGEDIDDDEDDEDDIDDDDEDDEDDIDDDLDVDEESTHDDVKMKKRIVKNKPSLAERIQYKAQNYEAKSAKKRAKRAEDIKHLKLAGKAVAAAPSRMVDDVKSALHNMDQKDDDRRKAKMVEPGQRNQVFHKLKTALIYGGAATANLALLPVLAFARHLSKNKDRRVRNELQRDIQTEIDICQEKINDASSNGDQKEKYKLMRIKSKLEAELLRVKTNSKFI